MLLNMSQDVRMTSEHVQSKLKLFRWLSNVLKTFEKFKIVHYMMMSYHRLVTVSMPLIPI